VFAFPCGSVVATRNPAESTVARRAPGAAISPVARRLNAEPRRDKTSLSMRWLMIG
jgi:hypothetical protein